MATKKTEEAMPMDMEAVKAEIAQYLAEAKAAKEEAEKLLAEAKATNGRKRGEMDEALRDSMEEYVEVRLFKDNNKYKDDVMVGVNGEFCLIQRGVPVKIKRKFAEVLDASSVQDYETSVMLEKKQAEYRAAQATHNL